MHCKVINDVEIMLAVQLDVERKLRRLLEYDKREAEEIVALAQGLCSGAMVPP